MKHSPFRRLGSLGSLGVAVAVAMAIPAQASAKQAASTEAPTTPVDTSMCTTPTLTQEFLAWGDTNLYAPVGGQSSAGFDGTGWTLTGGAKIVTTTLADGSTGTVLDLPAGSQATSPTVCLTSQYPTARMMVSNVTGSNGGKMDFSVSYAGTSSASSPVETGTFKTTGQTGVSGGWLLSDPEALEPSSSAGWQPMQITLAPSGPNKAEFQIYNLYVDPRCAL